MSPVSLTWVRRRWEEHISAAGQTAGEFFRSVVGVTRSPRCSSIKVPNLPAAIAIRSALAMLIIRRTSELSLRTLTRLSTTRCYSKDYASSSDDEKEPKKRPNTTATATTAAPPGVGGDDDSAAARLNRLLASMNADDNALSRQLPTPGEGHRKRKEAAKREAGDRDVVQAAKRVASLLGDDHKKQTESELLAKLLGHAQQEESGTGAAAKPTAARKSDATSTNAAGQEADMTLSELIVGMKIDRRQPSKEQTRGDYVRRTLGQRQPHHQQHHQYPSQKYGGGGGNHQQQQQQRQRPRTAETYTGSVNLFGGEPLGIFQPAKATLRDSPDVLATWAQLERRELKLQVTHPPTNYFAKMAQWTEEGKLWRFPIDNEQDLAAEADVDFAAHVFLEQHLEPWCPTRGPLRHFMELVCVGLAKNPHIGADAKRAHIHWYRDYFQAKRDLLGDLLLLGGDQAAATNKQLEA